MTTTANTGTTATTDGSQLASFRERCERIAGRPLPTAAELHEFSITDADAFWSELLEWSDLLREGRPDPVRTSTEVEHAAFFPGVRLNYAENLLRALPGAGDSAPALTAVHADRPAESLTRGELRTAVERTAVVLDGLGVGVGSRVVAIAPNNVGVLVGGLAVAALGATLSTATPDMGPAALLGRFSQVEPQVLLIDRTGLGSGGTPPDDVLAALLAGLPTTGHVLVLDQLPLPEPTGAVVVRLADLVAEMPPGAGVPWPRLPFDHPLWVMFSSGTTGPPKAMVHGAGGSLLEHVKEHRLHGDLDVRDTLYFHTTTAWMMWNWQLSALAVGAHVVVYDGPVTGPETLWRLVAEHRVTVFGTSPAYLQLCQDEGFRPADALDLHALRSILSTGSVLHDWQFDWVAEAVGDLPLQSISGGTDIVGCFVLGHPEQPVLRGRAQSLSLGLDVAALDDAGRPVIGEVGALVCRQPFPSRPVGFLRDPGGDRFHAAYFAGHPGVWTHGDQIEIDASGSARLHGRSDGVLNVNGIRIGPSEIYTIVRRIPRISDALAVEQRDPASPGSTRLVLLVVPQPGTELSDGLRQEIRATLRREGSPAHVPARVLGVEELPYTHNGKRSESAARAVLNGDPVRNSAALRNPGCLPAIAAAAAAAEPVGDLAGAVAADDVAAVVARAVRSVLGAASLDGSVSFFDAGGTSRQSMTLLRRLRIELGRPVPMDLFLADPSIDGLSRALAGAPADAGRLEVMRPGDPGQPPLFLIHGAYGDVDSYRTLAEHLTVRGAVYGVLGDVIGPDGVPRSVAELAALHIAELSVVQPAGPVRLAGYSFGGLVAFEMARLLTAAGRDVDFLGLLDPAPPAASLTPFERKQSAVGKKIALFLPGFSDTTLRRVVQGKFRTATLSPESQALRRASGMANEYRWAPYAGPVTYFRAVKRVPVLTNVLSAWRRVAPQLTVVAVPGAHHDLLRERSGPVLAQRVSDAVARAGDGNPGTPERTADAGPGSATG